MNFRDPPTQLVVHHSASPRDTTTLENIRDWHLQRGFHDVGYHWVIEMSGTIRNGRSPIEVGAHVKGNNMRTLGVCLAGDNTKPNEHWSMMQWDALFQLVNAVRVFYPAIEVVRHCDLAATECPAADI